MEKRTASGARGKTHGLRGTAEFPDAAEWRCGRRMGHVPSFEKKLFTIREALNTFAQSLSTKDLSFVLKNL